MASFPSRRQGAAARTAFAVCLASGIALAHYACQMPSVPVAYQFSCAFPGECLGDEQCVAGCCVPPGLQPTCHAGSDGGRDGGVRSDAGSCSCRSGQFQCSGTTSLKSCDDGCNWTTDVCDTLCRTNGYAGTTGCQYSASKGHDICVCNALGIGEKCKQGPECTSNVCTGGGWCTTTCRYSDPDCKGVDPSGKNSFGNYNWCVPTVNDGGNRCFPGCFSGNTTFCPNNYAGTTCKSLKTTVGTDVTACSF